MDLPHAYPAYLFATININQRKVDKSLAYEQFGYNLDEESNRGWSPDKLSVYLTRKLNLDPSSPLHGHIKIAPIYGDDLLPQTGGWQVSTAAIVEGIMKLIASSPTRDRDLLHKQTQTLRSRESLPDDSAPLRDVYRSSRDEELFTLLRDYFSKVADILWISANERSYARKTVGIQALFDILRMLAAKKSIAEIPAAAEQILKGSSKVDFSDAVFQASGKGRVLVRNTIWLFGGRVKLGQLPEQDQKLYAELLAKYS
jgi:DGQHR domain-containing protein